MSIKCWVGNHAKISVMIGLIFIILWSIIFPLAIAIKLWRIRKNLDDKTNLLRFGLFYVGLTDNAFYWEIIFINARKMFFIIFATLMSGMSGNYKVILSDLSLIGFVWNTHTVLSCHNHYQSQALH